MIEGKQESLYNKLAAGMASEIRNSDHSNRSTYTTQTT